MSGTSERVVADTSVLISLLRGDKVALAALDGLSVCVSVITEIELLAYPELREDSMVATISLLSAMGVVELSTEVKRIAIDIRRKRILKLPDSLIAATAIALGVPLLTGDQRFRKVTDRLEVRELKLSR